MNNNPTIGDLFVLFSPPEGFPTKKKGTTGMCAMFSLKALIEGYGEREIKKVQHYAQDIFSKISGFMLPFSVQRVLKKEHIPYQKFYGRGLKYEQKLTLLKNRLKNGPIFLLIANAYGSGIKPNLLRALSHRHYITVRGYDDKKQIFFVYDSNTKKRIFSGVPIGNSRMPYKTLIKNRSIGALWLLRSYGIQIFYSKIN
ncbi:MAG: hypothetical protein LBI53_07775 [Candidatus Peribacteria bacterium]|jgi:hypothetical protein|nr:hypothetical protein [Candidatus Peribacteria bacterium]